MFIIQEFMKNTDLTFHTNGNNIQTTEFQAQPQYEISTMTVCSKSEKTNLIPM